MPQSTPFDTILTQCRDLVCERLAQAMTGMLDKADDALSALINGSRDPQTQKIYLVTRNKLAAQHEAMVTQFRMRYMREFQERGNRVKKIGDRFDEIDLSTLELELVEEDDLNESIKFNAMATKVRQYCDEELVALDQRVGVLLGDASLQPEDNPFTPQAICDAYKQTCRQIDSNVNVRMVLLKLFDDHVLDDIRAVYKAVNALLVQNAILPKIRGYAAGQQKQAKAAPPVARPAAENRESVAPADDKPAAGEQDFFSVLQNLLTSNVKPPGQSGAAGGTGAFVRGATAMPGGPAAAGGGAVSGAAILQGAELLRSLTRLQLGDASGVTGGSVPLATVASQPGTTNILQELKATSVGSGMNQMDNMTLDIMAMLFDELFDDPKIPVSVKGLIGRLQIPMLKVAISDKSFFSKKTHPARQMLDTLGEISTRLPADVDSSDPIFARLESILQELIVGFEDDINIFDLMRERLQALIDEEDGRIEMEILSAAKQVQQLESLALAKSVAQAEIKVRIRSSMAPRIVIEFLVQQWVKLLMVVQVKDGEKSDAWKNALETMDLLLWSVEPKHTLAERRDLVSTLPELVKSLTDGLKFAGVEDDVRVNFFADLRKVHSDIIRKSARLETADESEEPETSDSPEASETVAESELPESVEKTHEMAILSSPEEPVTDPTLELPETVATTEDITIAEKPEELAIDAKPEMTELESSPDASPAGDISSFELPPILEFEPAPRESATPAPTPPSVPSATESAPAQAEAEAPHDASPVDDISSFELPPILEFEPAPREAAPPAPTPPVNPPVAGAKPAPTKTAQPAPTTPPKPAAAAPTPAATKIAQPLPAQPPKPASAAPTPAPTKTAQPVPAQPPKPAPAPPKPVPTKTAQPVPAPPLKPGATPSKPVPTKTAQPVPAQPLRPPAAKPGAAPKEPVRAAAASTARSPMPSAGQRPNTGALDLTAPVVVKNPFGEGKVQVDDLDFTAIIGDKTAGATSDAGHAVIPGNLSVGSWWKFVRKAALTHTNLPSCRSSLRSRPGFFSLTGRDKPFSIVRGPKFRGSSSLAR